MDLDVGSSTGSLNLFTGPVINWLAMYGDAYHRFCLPAQQTSPPSFRPSFTNTFVPMALPVKSFAGTLLLSPTTYTQKLSQLLGDGFIGYGQHLLICIIPHPHRGGHSGFQQAVVVGENQSEPDTGSLRIHGPVGSVRSGLSEDRFHFQKQC